MAYLPIEDYTSAGIPVFNVALPVLRRSLSEEFPVKVIEIAVARAVSVAQEPPSRRRDDPG